MNTWTGVEFQVMVKSDDWVILTRTEDDLVVEMMFTRGDAYPDLASVRFTKKDGSEVVPTDLRMPLGRTRDAAISYLHHLGWH